VNRAGEIWELSGHWNGTKRRDPTLFLCLGDENGYYLLLSFDDFTTRSRATFLFDDPLPPSPAIECWTRVA
jgi:hypothetical protein